MSKNKTAVAISLFLMFAMTFSLVALPANAHDPAWQIPTYSFCHVAPTPVGVGQTVTVNFWVNQPPPTANQQFGDRWENMHVIVTKPDGSKETLGPFTSDDTGGTFTTYTPEAAGNYTFQMVFDGQTIVGANPSQLGVYQPEFIGDYFEPSKSNVFTVTVQEEPIPGTPVTPLPTNYWTRPIYGENNEWYQIGGNWLGFGLSTFANTGMYNESGNYNPYTTAPNSAHILWTQPAAWGGMIGGEFGSSETSNYYATSQYEPKFAPIIMQGVLYYTRYPGTSYQPAGWAAVDLHTGKTLWTKNTTDILRCGQILNMHTPNQYGALAYLWSNPVGDLKTGGGSRPGVGGSLDMWDAMTGNFILSIANATAQGRGGMPIVEDEQGDLIGYFVDYANPSGPTLNMWNSTRCINLSHPSSSDVGPLADNWYWRPTTGTEISFDLGIQWSAPIATEYSGNALPGSLGITGINSGVVYMTLSSVTGRFYQAGWIIEAGYDANTGSQLWITNRTEVVSTRVLSGSATMGSGAYVELDSSALTASGYSLKTGEKLWGPTALPNVSPFASLGMQYVVANGTIYVWTYGGDVYAINILTGAIKWEYHTPSGGFESPYGEEPLWTFTVGTVADGKLFVPEGHMYSPPLFHQAQQLALNLTDGSVVWSIDAFDVTSAPAISDGVMTTLNAYDNQIYAYGKGPSATTVTASPKISVHGDSILVEGTVTDKSAGTQQDAVAANFPNGLPCVSDESMSDWMEYVYMQQPKPTNATGVKVTVSVLDPNNNCYNVGTATSDDNGFFSTTFTPEVPGKYTVYATFTGSESYYGSSAVTAINVENTPAATPEPTPIPASLADIYFLPMSIGIIIVIVVVGLLLVLMLRKR